MIKWFVKTPTIPQFENHILIIPAVSVGNVGQLTIDLVLENARSEDSPKKVGQIFHPGLEPVVANNVEQNTAEVSKARPQPHRRNKPEDPEEVSKKLKETSFVDVKGNNNSSTNIDLETGVGKLSEEKDCLMTACESCLSLSKETMGGIAISLSCPKGNYCLLHFTTVDYTVKISIERVKLNRKKHVLVFQRDREKFISFLVQWIEDSQFKMLVCFSSIFTSERLDANISGLSSRIQVLYSEKTDISYLEKVQLLGWKRLLSPTLTATNSNIQPLEYIEENLAAVNISGSGITKNLLLNCQSKGVPCLTLMIYASDGDNSVDAIYLYKESSKLFHFLPQPRFGDPPTKIKIPYIWHQHLGVNPKFGPDEDDQIIISAPSRSRRTKYDNPPNTIF